MAGTGSNNLGSRRCKTGKRDERAKRVRFLRIVVRMELGHRLERWLAWVGEANHSNLMRATNRDAPMRLLQGAF
jgi:hypothetical protein